MKSVSLCLSIILANVFLSRGIIFAASIPEENTRQEATCGYQSCTKSEPDKLNIHLVAHTHDDVGWLKTVDQYFLGLREGIQRASVRDIIDSVIDALDRNPKRKFIYVETAFLWKWWLSQSVERRESMKRLIKEGRLEIIGGGWVMNDEATTHYQSLIDQYTWGFRRLNDTFGECARPKIGWQIDPFGHSREQASMFAQLGFDGLLFARLDYQDKNHRLRFKSMEFIWQASPSLGPDSNLFTSVLFDHYSAPQSFCFDVLCPQNAALIDDPRNPHYNIERRVQDFLYYAKAQASVYRTNNILIAMGDDFHYRFAEMYLSNIDKLIEGIDRFNGSKYKAFYSTPSCYLKALNEQNLSWMTKRDDFFPYSSDPHAFWTGYFTSRPTLKYFERMANNFLQVVKQLSVLSGAGDSKELELFREAMAVMQHHDAVTGTEKQHVAKDYARILHQSMKKGEGLASEALSKLTRKKKSDTDGEEHGTARFYTCYSLNISACEHTSEHSTFVVTIYNPTSQPLNTYVRLPVAESQYSLKDFNGDEMVSQLVPVPERVLKIPGRVSLATRELVFRAVHIPALSYRSYYVKQRGENDPDQLDSKSAVNQSVAFSSKFQVEANERGDGVLVSKSLGVAYEQVFEYYNSKSNSGAYVFRPKYNQSLPLQVTANRSGSFQQFKGALVQETHQQINDWVSQVVRVYNDEDYVEFDWLIGPIPREFTEADLMGTEVITKYYASEIDNGDEFYTDSNGREMMKRKLNYRPTWQVELDETISGNYYPVTTKISIEDKSTRRHRMSVLTDRAEGGSSLSRGQIELMIHRRLFNDDGFGLGEPLNEYAYGKPLEVRGQHIVVTGDISNRDELLLQEKQQAINLSLRPWIFVTPTLDSFEKWSENYEMKGETIIGKLPKNVRILTLEPWKDDSILLRLEHLFEIDESPEHYSVTTRITINDLFPNWNLLSVVETILGANQRAEDNERLIWRTIKNKDGSEVHADREITFEDGKIIVNLKPMEIRTFMVKLSPGRKN